MSTDGAYVPAAWWEHCAILCDEVRSLHPRVACITVVKVRTSHLIASMILAMYHMGQFRKQLRLVWRDGGPTTVDGMSRLKAMVSGRTVAQPHPADGEDSRELWFKCLKEAERYRKRR